MIFNKSKKLREFNEHLEGGLKSGHFQKEACNDPENKALLEMGERLYKDARPANNNAPSGDFREKLLSRLLAARTKKPMDSLKTASLKDRIFGWLDEKMPVMMSPKGIAPGLALLLILGVGGYLIMQTMLGGLPINTVRAGEGFVPVNEPIRIEFPYKKAEVRGITPNFSITPEVKGSLSFSDGILTIEHEKNLRYQTEYIIKISAGANLGDKVLDKDFTLNFTTRPRGEKRVLSLNPGFTFQIYNLNFHDAQPEIFLSGNGSTEEKYNFKVFKSSESRLLQTYKNPASYNEDKGGWIKNNAENTKAELVDSQALTVGPGLPDEKQPELSYFPKLKERGIYFVEVKKQGDKDSDYSFFLVYSGNAITSKWLGNKLVSWVVDEKTSAGVDGAEVAGLQYVNEEKKEFKELFKEKADKNGIIEKTFAGGEGAANGFGNRPDLLISRSGSDIALNFLTTSSWTRDLYSQDWSNRLRDYIGYVYTDRPIYKPGDRVEFKAIVRKDGQEAYKILDQEIKIIAKYGAYGMQEDLIFEQKLKPNDFGSVNGAINLGKELKSGQYTISAEYDGKEIGSAIFDVEFYVKPDFEIKVATERENYIKGESVKVNLDGHFYFGAPLAGETVDWRIFGYYGAGFKSGQGNFDANGKLVMDIPTNDIELFNDTWWGGAGMPITIEASVTDKSGRTTAGSHTFNIFDGQYNLKIVEPQNIWNLQSGKNYKFKVRAEDNLTEKGKSGQKVSYRLYENDWDYVDYKENRNLIKEATSTTDVAGDIEFDFEAKKGGSYLLELKVADEKGNVITRDYGFWVGSISYADIQSNKKEFADQIVISPDKESYKVGETAVIKLQLPRTTGQLFYSLNKNSIRSRGIEAVDGYIKEIKVPITEDLAPGFYLYANIFQDDIFIEKTFYIEVAGKKINVELKANKETYSPGEEAQIKIIAKDENGRPQETETSLAVVDKAIFALQSDQTQDIYEYFYAKPEDWMVSLDSLDVVSLTMAEKGGCFLSGTQIKMADGTTKAIEEIKTGDRVMTREGSQSEKLVTDTVTKTFEHRVAEYLLINGRLKVTPVHRVLVNGQWKEIGQARLGDWIYDDAGRQLVIEKIETRNEIVNVYNFTTKEYHTYFADGIYVHNDKGGGGMRSNFKDTAYWNPNIITNAQGEATVSFKLPDNLSTWAALARSITKDTKAGQAKLEFKTAKDLVIMPNLPQFFRVGDRMAINALVQNSTGNTGQFKAELGVTGARLNEGFIKTIEIGSNENKVVSWDITVLDADKVKLTYKISGNEKFDGVETVVPVYSNLNYFNEVQSGSGEGKIEFSFPDGSQKNRSDVSLSVNPSVLSSFPDIIAKLTGYPYGCVEQTMSHHLPNILVAKNKDVLGLEPPEDLDKQLKDGFDRLAKMQNYDGGFGWWDMDNNNAWISGYVMEGMIEAKQAGLLNNRDMAYDRLLTHLSGILGSVGDEEKAYLSFVLSKADKLELSAPNTNLQDQTIIDKNGVKAMLIKLADEIKGGKEIDPQSKGYVALGLENAGEHAKAMEILKIVRSEMKGDHWEMKGQEDMYYFDPSMKDKYSATGVNLLAIVRIDYNKDEAGKIVNWLMANRNGYEGLWGSTRQSAQVFYALIAYLDKSQELKPNYTLDVYLNGEKIKSEKINSSKSKLVISLPKEKIKAANSLELKKNGTGNIYWVLSKKIYVRGDKLAGGDPDLNISRTYEDMDGKKLSQFKTGDLVKVKLHVSPKEQKSYVMLTDYLPAGFEAVNNRLSNTPTEYFDTTWSGMWAAESVDYREERVVLFRSDLWAGDYDFEYIARVRAKGSFSAPAPRIEMMYAPQSTAYGQESIINIEK